MEGKMLTSLSLNPLLLTVIWVNSPPTVTGREVTLIEKKPYFTKIALNPILFLNINFKKYVHTDR